MSFLSSSILVYFLAFLNQCLSCICENIIKNILKNKQILKSVKLLNFIKKIWFIVAHKKDKYIFSYRTITYKIH